MYFFFNLKTLSPLKQNEDWGRRRSRSLLSYCVFGETYLIQVTLGLGPPYGGGLIDIYSSSKKDGYQGGTAR